jgi:hypothetical protein
MAKGQAMVGIDLRFFASHALPARVDALMRNLGDEWKKIVVSMLEGQANEMESRESRAERLEKIALQVSMLDLTKAEKGKKWEEMTGLKVAQYYNMLKSGRAGQRR